MGLKGPRREKRVFVFRCAAAAVLAARGVFIAHPLILKFSAVLALKSVATRKHGFPGFPGNDDCGGVCGLRFLHCACASFRLMERAFVFYSFSQARPLRVKEGKGSGEGVTFIVYPSTPLPVGYSGIAARKTWFSLAPLRGGPHPVGQIRLAVPPIRVKEGMGSGEGEPKGFATLLVPLPRFPANTQAARLSLHARASRNL